MAKLYPPYVDHTLPAFVVSDDTQNISIKVPFQFNRAVGRMEVTGMALILKTVQNSVTKVDGLISKNILFDPKTGNYFAVFDLQTFRPSVGQYYKVQIAFVNSNNDIGYYSDISTIKCTTSPDVEIQGLSQGVANNSSYSYTGIYRQDAGRDATERVYEYCFNIYDGDTDQIIDSSDWQLHNASFDISPAESKDEWKTAKTLDHDKLYKIQYCVKTLNKLYAESAVYQLFNTDTVNLNINADLCAYLQPEDAYVSIALQPHKDANKKLLTGSFVLTRASSEDNFQSWHELYRFNMRNNYPDQHLWNDYTIQQGYQYKYALQAYNDYGLYSNRLEALYYLKDVKIDEMIVEFEDAFLFDGKRQLKIRYNPKVSSFKTTILESKVNTLGGKYPFIFRNGNVEYKEFPISGLISLLSDPNGEFLPDASLKDFHRTKTPQLTEDPVAFDTTLSRDNFRREREFKLEVLKWLSNGEPKLFRSPGEGSYIVRLSNVSLTPNDTLSRMLHTFNCTAYEIADCTFENLNKYGFIDSADSAYKELKIGMVNLDAALRSSGNDTYSFGQFGGAYYLHFDNQWSSLILQLTFADGTVSSYSFDISNNTGHYTIPEEVTRVNPVVQIALIGGVVEPQATITFGYYDTNVENIFSVIAKIDLSDEVRQFIGTPTSAQENIINKIEDIRQKTGRFYLIKIMPKKIYQIYSHYNYYYADAAHTVQIENWDPTALYFVANENCYYTGEPIKENKLDKQPNYTCHLNHDNIIDLQTEHSDPHTMGRFETLTDVGTVELLSIGSGLICDVAYHLKTYTYSIEIPPLVEAYGGLEQVRTNWLVCQEEYHNAVLNDSPIEELQAKEKAMNEAYHIYVITLETFLNNLKEKGDSINAL